MDDDPLKYIRRIHEQARFRKVSFGLRAPRSQKIMAVMEQRNAVALVATAAFLGALAGTHPHLFANALSNVVLLAIAAAIVVLLFVAVRAVARNLKAIVVVVGVFVAYLAVLLSPGWLPGIWYRYLG